MKRIKELKAAFEESLSSIGLEPLGQYLLLLFCLFFCITDIMIAFRLCRLLLKWTKFHIARGDLFKIVFTYSLTAVIICSTLFLIYRIGRKSKWIKKVCKKILEALSKVYYAITEWLFPVGLLPTNAERIAIVLSITGLLISLRRHELDTNSRLWYIHLGDIIEKIKNMFH